MGMSTKANDWRCLCVMQVGFASGVGVGSFMFDWYSAKARISARMLLTVSGFGLGGNLGGTALPTLNGKDGGWSDISGNEAFSINDLSGSEGWIRSAGIGVGVGFSLTDISAKKSNADDYLFEDQGISGFATGLGASVYCYNGTWGFARVVRSRPPVVLQPLKWA